MSVPTPEAQLEFLTQLQRLFSEGEFTATYKYALLISLAELAVERAAEADPVFALEEIAARFVDLYWQQSAIYPSARPAAVPGVLVQNRGRQAQVVSALAKFRASHGVTTVHALRVHADYPTLVREVAATVRDQPLHKLQTFGRSSVTFLYHVVDGKVHLAAGVAYCLRRFQPLIQQLARSHWVAHIKGNSRNADLIGEVADLESFLFEHGRHALDRMAAGLFALDDGRCFYCDTTLTRHHVDHFVPFATYPRDLGHNFVLAHDRCNQRKSDSLAGAIHLERWLARLLRKRDHLAEIAEGAGIRHDAAASRAIARWSYELAKETKGQAWLRERVYEPVTARFVEMFS